MRRAVGFLHLGRQIAVCLFGRSQFANVVTAIAP
jgi:hypothetical protein